MPVVFFPFLTFLSCKYLLLKMKNELITRPAQNYVNVHRQTGNYFVSAANAAKILFRKHSAIKFLKFTGKDTSGNKLEQDVFAKLHDSAELAHLKADGLMYTHVYGDLCMLSLSQMSLVYQSYL